MRTITTVTWAADDITEHLNLSKDLLVDLLENQGKIDKDTAENLRHNYAFLCYKEGILGRWWKKLKGEKKNSELTFEIIHRPDWKKKAD